MVGALAVRLAVPQAERLLVASLIAPVVRHVGAGLGQGRRFVASVHLVAAACTGVRRRCQLDCQENKQKETGEPGLPANRVAQR